MAFFLIAGAQYFVVFYFGADAVRYLRPKGGYDLYFLYPTFLYEFLIIIGVAPEANRRLTGHEELFKPEPQPSEVQAATENAITEAINQAEESVDAAADAAESLLSDF